MKTNFETVELTLDTPFTIARGTTDATENIIVSIEANGKTGYGAAAPSPRYSETTATVEALLPDLLSIVESVGDPHARREITDRMRTVTRGNPAARAAIDIALWDLAGKLLETPSYGLLGLSGSSEYPQTSFTIGIDETQRMRNRAQKAVSEGYSTLKVKLGTDRDLEIIEAIRAAVPDASIRVDANEAWTPKEAVRICRALETYEIEFVEQPIRAEDLAGLGYVNERSPLPIAADEPCRTAADVPSVADRCDIVNLKLMKTGGITPAIELIHTARSHGLKVMCGCMIETNASISGAAQLLPLLDYTDLDGSLLLESDPYRGVSVTSGQFDLESIDAGTGVQRR